MSFTEQDILSKLNKNKHEYTGRAKKDIPEPDGRDDWQVNKKEEYEVAYFIADYLNKYQKINIENEEDFKEATTKSNSFQEYLKCQGVTTFEEFIEYSKSRDLTLENISEIEEALHSSLERSRKKLEQEIAEKLGHILK
ncbi:hypothetical protein [Acinetobacter sp. HY1485]|uniref:hypothetical protein n=1 Tax=Acinetobacter sp. HY1485 TaxID=2970918 RepID=UPI0022B966D4|nr:hypothetical protein [Acinetobacter sp. HY1485]